MMLDGVGLFHPHFRQSSKKMQMTCVSGQHKPKDIVGIK